MRRRRSPYRPQGAMRAFFAAFCALGAIRRRSPYRPRGGRYGLRLRLCAPCLRAWARIRLRACLRQGRAVLRQERDSMHSGAQRARVACDDADAIILLFGRNFCVRNAGRRIKNKHPWHDKCYCSPAHRINRTAGAGDFARIPPKRSIPFRRILLQDRASVRR